jgi:hypothetical protein
MIAIIYKQDTKEIVDVVHQVLTYDGITIEAATASLMPDFNVFNVCIVSDTAQTKGDIFQEVIDESDKLNATKEQRITDLEMAIASILGGA